MQKIKPWYMSVTIWFNIALAVVVFLQTVSPLVGLTQFIAPLAVVGNILLRFKTDSSIIPQVSSTTPNA